ncbi:hypothetical protein [Nocardia sp. NPDC005998]|uniref:hypothetical protein n=1 Tax=Nocardia sp. NPDC005998 TaxID=3156894 RepID=UPI0033AFFBE0
MAAGRQGAGRDDNAATDVTAAVRQITVQRNAAAAGSSLAALSQGRVVAYELLEPSAVDPGLARAVSFVFAFLLCMASFLFDMGVVEEKIYRRSLMQAQGRLTIRQALKVQD